MTDAREEEKKDWMPKYRSNPKRWRIAIRGPLHVKPYCEFETDIDWCPQEQEQQFSHEIEYRMKQLGFIKGFCYEAWIPK